MPEQATIYADGHIETRQVAEEELPQWLQNQKAEAVIQEAMQLSAKARLQKMQAETTHPAALATALTTAFSYAGEDWHILRMDFPHLAMVGVMMGQDGYDLGGERTIGWFGSLTSALLHCAVATSADDLTPYFDPQVARAYAAAPAANGLVSFLFDKITDVNPVFPKKKAPPVAPVAEATTNPA